MGIWALEHARAQGCQVRCYLAARDPAGPHRCRPRLDQAGQASIKLAGRLQVTGKVRGLAQHLLNQTGVSVVVLDHQDADRQVTHIGPAGRISTCSRFLLLSFYYLCYVLSIHTDW